MELNTRSFRAAWLGGRISSGSSCFSSWRAGADWSRKRSCRLVRQQVREVKKLTDKPFGVNIMLMSPYADEIAQVIVEEKFQWLQPVQETLRNT